jgi:hypothetical protein
VAKVRNRYKPKPPQDALAQREQSAADRRAMLQRVGAVEEDDDGLVATFSIDDFTLPKPAPPLPVVHRTGKALGFRSWKLEGYNLFSANEQFGGWKVGEPTEAVCRSEPLTMVVAMQRMANAINSQMLGSRPHFHTAVKQAAPPPDPKHAAPHPGCECGLYALHAPEFMSRWHQNEPLMVHGAVLGWGRMEVHHEGWRAQYAQPVMLAFDGDRQPYNHCERVKAMGGELGLPVVEWPDFEAEARKLAAPVPDDLRPKAPPPDRFGGHLGGSLVGAGGYWMPSPFAPSRYAPGRTYHCGHCGMSTTNIGAGPAPGPPCSRCGQ